MPVQAGSRDVISLLAQQLNPPLHSCAGTLAQAGELGLVTAQHSRQRPRIVVRVVKARNGACAAARLCQRDATAGRCGLKACRHCCAC